ncbi:hypothetical protein ASF70_08220 [Rhizobium sp. Leaf321]|nr:hypothetical protein ASF70_08220 [Rhizobium sp. Leaf321]
MSIFKRPLMLLGGAIVGLGLSYSAAMALGLCVFVVTITDSPGGELQFVGTTRSFPAGSSIILVPMVITQDSDFALQCDRATRRDGYITGGLQILVYVKIRQCEIATYKTFG